MIGPLFTDDERYAILEYLKVHRDLPATPADFQPPQCRLLRRNPVTIYSGPGASATPHLPQGG